MRGPVVVNGLYEPLGGLDVSPEAAAEEAEASLRPGEPDALAAAAEFRRERSEIQREQMSRLSEALPLPQLRLPYVFDAEIGTAQLDRLAAALLDGVHDLDAAALGQHEGVS